MIKDLDVNGYWVLDESRNQRFNIMCLKHEPTQIKVQGIVRSTYYDQDCESVYVRLVEAVTKHEENL